VAAAEPSLGGGATGIWSGEVRTHVCHAPGSRDGSRVAVVAAVEQAGSDREPATNIAIAARLGTIRSESKGDHLGNEGPNPRTSADPDTGPRVLGLAFAWIFLALSLVAGSAPYTGEAIGFYVPVPARVEIVDHVVPAVVTSLVALYSLAIGRFPFTGMLVVSLAGLWMTATHAPLLANALGGVEPMSAALWHSLPGIGLFIAALVGIAVLWNDSDQRGAPGHASDR
jgi:hypothetical protein